MRYVESRKNAFENVYIIYPLFVCKRTNLVTEGTFEVSTKESKTSICVDGLASAAKFYSSPRKRPSVSAVLVRPSYNGLCLMLLLMTQRQYNLWSHFQRKSSINYQPKP